MNSRRFIQPLSFNHLVGEREHSRRDFEAKRLGGLKVQHQLELGWLLHGKIAGLLAPENAGHVDAGLAKRIRQAWTIADQAAAGSELAVPVDRGERMASRQGSNLVMDALEERIIHCDQGVPIGMMSVAALAAWAGAFPPDATITVTCRRTSSAASSGSRSYCPSAQRYSNATLRPSAQPARLRLSRNAASRCE